MVEETLYSVHSASMPSGFISLKRTLLFVIVHISFLLHVTLTLQPCIFDSSLFITGVIGLPLNNENITTINYLFPRITLIIKLAFFKSSELPSYCQVKTVKEQYTYFNIQQTSIEDLRLQSKNTTYP